MRSRYLQIRLFKAACVAMLLAGSASAGVPDSGFVRLKLESGEVEGRAADGVLSFKGIPYAAPPLGALRWQAPKAAIPWVGLRPALDYGPDCMQKPQPGDLGPIGGPISEDCLFLNVWRPVGSADNLPVMVWIHGGGFVNGGASPAIFDGSAFARQGVILVSFNYRLGRFGFFAHPALSAADEGPLANYGYMDQREALRWVQRNITALGGDPKRVTVFGESAGGASVLDLVGSSLQPALFQRAIVMSGGGRGAIGGLLGDLHLRKAQDKRPSAEQTGLNFAKAMGVKGNGPEALAALRALPAQSLVGDLNMGYLLRFLLPWRSLTYAMGPVADGEGGNASTGASMPPRSRAPLPMIIGTTGQDLGFSAALSKNRLFAQFDTDAALARAEYDPDGTGKLLELSAQVGADQAMNEPARFVARSMAKAGHAVWLYRFYYVADSQRDDKQRYAGHASELPFVFDNLDAAYGDKVTDDDRRMARQINTYFANFAKAGDPAGTGLPPWGRVDPSRSKLMRFTLDEGPQLQADPWQRRLDLLEAVDR